MAGWVLGCSYTRFKHRELERELFRKAQEDMEIECIKNPGKIAVDGENWDLHVSHEVHTSWKWT